MEINISKDFTMKPGARYKTESNYSGEQFREQVLEPKFLEAKKTGDVLLIDLDGCYGYGTNFLEEAFGGLARKYNKYDVIKYIYFKSNEQPSLPDKIKKYIENAND